MQQLALGIDSNDAVQPGSLPSSEADKPAAMSPLANEIQSLWTAAGSSGVQPRIHLSERSICIHADARDWIATSPENCIHAVITDPPYGLIEYENKDHEKLRSGRGGVWRIPPSFDGVKRKPLPRFTVLTNADLAALTDFFEVIGQGLLRTLVPGGHLFIASNPLLSSVTFSALQRSGLEKRGEIIRLVQTLRGGDRPKGAEQEFAGVSMMPRSCWEPWGIFRKPLQGTAAQNLQRWGTGGLRRLSAEEPFKDVIPCAPARGKERQIASHPSLKPQRFLRQLVRAALPLGIGIIYDPFAGSGSTLAAAQAIGCPSIGTERDEGYLSLVQSAFGPLSQIEIKEK